jgi:PAS domain S-box-containing protein
VNPEDAKNQHPAVEPVEQRRLFSFMETHLVHDLRPAPDQPRDWLRYAAIIRLALLAVISVGAFVIVPPDEAGRAFLFAYYIFGFVASLSYLVIVYRKHNVPVLLTWGQVLVDLAVVAATIALTSGPTSFFTFLFVVVILEATLLIGISHGYIFATLATVFMTMATIMPPASATVLPHALTSWYSLLVEALAFYLTASISGYLFMRLRRLQQFQIEILDHLNTGFLITDNAGGVAAVNTAGESILALQENEAIGQPVQEVLHVRSGGECPVLTAIRSRRDFTSYEFQAVLSDMQTKLLGLTTSRIHDSRGQFTGIIASFTDLTEMDLMRRELRRQDRLAVVGELAAGLAHEIRNPLAAIRGAVDELGGTPPEEPTKNKLLSIAMRESDQLNQIVEGFLDFARKPEIHRETFDGGEFVEAVAESLRLEYADNGDLRVDVSRPDEELLISADRSQVHQVLINIGKNGIEAMGKNGQLTISIVPDRTSVEIRINDEGTGVDPDMVARIFEPFYTTKATGVGMGLAVCQRIITAHDGTIRALSREGGGASFIVRLPFGTSED